MDFAIALRLEESSEKIHALADIVNRDDAISDSAEVRVRRVSELGDRVSGCPGVP